MPVAVAAASSTFSSSAIFSSNSRTLGLVETAVNIALLLVGEECPHLLGIIEDKT